VNDEVMKYYELLGVAAGASAQELKRAHRDLAKVWHPDRFAHDPRLQRKAQEKLKEINEAYDQLTVRKTGRRAPVSSPPDSPTNQTSTPPQTNARRSSWKYILLPTLAFALIFFAASRALIPSSKQSAQPPTPPTEQAQVSLNEEGQQSESDVKLQASETARNKRADQQPSREAKPDDAPALEHETRQMRPMPTVTLTIDPVSGMIATPDCPVKSRMTYPSGAEPHQYCNLSHKSAAPVQAEPARPKESRLKSFAKRLAAPAKLFGSKKGSDDGSRQDVKPTGSSLPK
jgi:DnaJ domain